MLTKAVYVLLAQPVLYRSLVDEPLPWVEGIILRRPTRLPVRGFTPL